MFCPNCGKEIKPGNAFCTGCGTRVDQLQQLAEEAPQQQEAPVYPEEVQEAQPVYPEDGYQEGYQEEYYEDEYPEEGYYQEEYQEYAAPPRRKMPVWALILIILGGVIVTAAIALALFLFVLKPKVQGPDLPAYVEETTTEAPVETTTSNTAAQTTTQAETTTPAASFPKTMWTTAPSGLLLREGPSQQYNAIYLIPIATQLSVDKIENNWAHTSIAGLSGWCSCDYLTDTPPEYSEPTTPAASSDPNTLVYPDTWIDYGYHGYVNTTDGLMFRLGPGTNYAAIDVIPYGTEVAEEGYYNNWIFIQYKGRYGWVCSDYITASGGMAKPAIYLYPETTMEISVDVELSEGAFTRSAPLYHNGWNVLATPEGVLTDPATGETYDYIYWESDSEPAYDWSEGYVVAGEDTRAFLLEVLPQMGLIPEEYNEFINYWLPRMQKNAYNLVTFQKECYTDAAKMTIEPQPDSVLRIFMAYKAIDGPVTVPAPSITPFERKGFTVVEWGGAEVQP